MKSLHELSPRAQVVVFVLLSAMVVGAGWQILIGPEREALASRNERLVNVQSDLNKASAVAHQLPAFEKDVARLEAELKETTASLPDEKDAEDVLRDLHVLASDASLDISSFAPKAATKKTQYSEWPIEVGLTGGYHDLGRFFDSVAGLDRLISISDLHIKAQGQGGPAAPPKPGTHASLTATCVATTYVFRPDSAPAASVGGKQ